MVLMMTMMMMLGRAKGGTIPATLAMVGIKTLCVCGTCFRHKNHVDNSYIDKPPLSDCLTYSLAEFVCVRYTVGG